MRLDTANYEHLLRENAALTAKLAEAEKADREWRRTIKECERIVGAIGTAENGLTCNLPNLIRDIVVERNSLRDRLASLDDPTPLTAEWVHEIGIADIDLVQHLKNAMDLGHVKEGEIRPFFKTRGQVRRLATGLGIQLKEDA